MLEYDLVIPAAGVGRRMGAKVPKPFIQLLGKDILEHTLYCFSEYLPTKIIIAADPEFQPRIKAYSFFSEFEQIELILVEGGKERQDSINNALKCSLAPWIAVHDAVRPFLGVNLLLKLMEVCQQKGSAIPAFTPRETIKVQANGVVEKTLRRDTLVQVQTPQFFNSNLYRTALQNYYENNASLITDDASLLELAGFKIHLVEGKSTNIKLTYPEDIDWAEWYLSREENVL